MRSHLSILTPVKTPIKTPITTLVLTLLTPLVLSPKVYGQVTELNCMHVVPIQMRYLQRHVNFTKLTPDLEKRTTEQFMKRLDGGKSFLLESDMQEVAGLLQNIFEKTRNLDCGPFIKANDLLVRRAEERVAFAHELLGPKFKINRSAKFFPDPANRVRPKTAAQANADYAKQMQWEVANYVANGISLDSAKSHVLHSLDRFIKHIHETKNKDIFANYLDTYATALDPHSSYMAPDGLEEFEIQMRLSLDGIGATLGSKDGFTTIEQLVPGGAAAVAGQLKRRDKIVGVGQGEVGPFTDILDMEVRDVIKLIRGPKGTAVRLQVLRKVASETQKLEFKVVRDKIKLEDQAASIHFVDREIHGEKLKIGLLNLPSFYHDDNKGGPTAATDLKKLLAEAKKNQADAVMLDLSNNGGGSLLDAVDVAGLFLASGNVVRLGKRSATDGGPLEFETLSDTDPNVDWAGPLVILTNRESASASEIVSGALQDYQRAVIVGGDHTFGKGTMQTVEGLNPGLGATKTTTGMFFTAGGQSTQHRGVSGDIVLPSVLSQDRISEKAMDYSLPPMKIEPFLSPSANPLEGKDSWIPINKQIITELKEKSKGRVAKNAEFRKVPTELKKMKKAPKFVLISSLFKDKTAGTKKLEDEDEDDKPLPSKEERLKQYLARVDVVEGLNVAADLVVELRTGHRGPSSAANH